MALQNSILAQRTLDKRNSFKPYQKNWGKCFKGNKTASNKG